jgi:dipeptidyl aminopeptidase/acylaminoacyl peptidase
MFRDFDLHLPSGRLALWRVGPPKIQGILLKDIHGNTLETIDHKYTQGPRLSPDGAQLAYFGDGRLHVHPLIKGKADLVVELPDHHVGFCEWSPNGRSLIFSAYRTPVSTTQPSRPSIYRYDFADGCITQPTDDDTLVDRFPQWSPSGATIAFHRTHFGTTDSYAETILIDRNGTNEQVLPRTEGYSQCISRYCWSPDNARIGVLEYEGYRRYKHEDPARFAVVRTADNTVAWSSEDAKIDGGGFDPYTGRILIAAQDALRLYEFPSEEPYAELALSGLAPVQITLSGPAVAFDPHGEAVYFLGADSRFYRWTISGGCDVLVEEEPYEEDVDYQRDDYRFRASDGRDIPVQRYLPDHPNGRAAVFVVGGPRGRIAPLHPIATRLLQEGYEVILPAYRGCDGYGREHLEANREVCGWLDVRDVVECGLDWKQRFTASDRPLAVSGFSYGGYLTFLALTHPDAPWTCGITFWGCTITPDNFGAGYLPSDPKARQHALQARSPVVQAHRIRFPLLILHGARDATPTKDARAIQDRVRASDIPCRLVIFEEETHGLRGRRPQMYRHMLAFLGEHMV